jgi:osmotically-inducible protein OsmY
MLREPDELALSPTPRSAPATDAELVEAMTCRLDAEAWVTRHLVRVAARPAVIELDGLVDSAAQHAAVVTMARTIPGCVDVEDHLVTQSEVLRKVPRLTRRI